MPGVCVTTGPSEEPPLTPGREEVESGVGAKINMALEAIIGVPASFIKKTKEKILV